MGKETEKKIELYKLNLHEIAIVAELDYSIQTVQRVPGGWIYRTDTKDFNGYKGGCTEVFVPFDNSFMSM